MVLIVMAVFSWMLYPEEVFLKKRQEKPMCLPFCKMVNPGFTRHKGGWILFMEIKGLIMLPESRSGF